MVRVTIARLLAFIAVVEGIIAIPVRLTDGTLFGIGGGGYLRAAVPTLLLAIFFVIDDLRDQFLKTRRSTQ